MPRSMSITCPSCSIRYASELPACPWCGHARQEVPANPAQAESVMEEPPTRTQSRSVPPPPPPPAATTSKGSVTYDLSDIPGPDEEWEPVDEWIDESYDGSAAVDPEERRLRRWVIAAGSVIALLALGAFLAEVLPFGVGSSDPEPPPTGAVATTLPPATTSDPVPTTTPPTTAPPAETTVPPTSAAPIGIDPIGDAIAVDDLRLGEDGLGVIEFGSEGNEAVGRLVATFGQPNADTGVRLTPAEEGGGFCEGEQQRQVRWGSLSVYLAVAADGSQSVASAQIKSVDATDPDPGAAIETISGLRLGDSVADLRSIYDGFDITVTDETGGGLWELRAGSDGRLLLWGTVSGGDPDSENIITSLRSSLRCGG